MTDLAGYSAPEAGNGVSGGAPSTTGEHVRSKQSKQTFAAVVALLALALGARNYGEARHFWRLDHLPPKDSPPLHAHLRPSGGSRSG